MATCPSWPSNLLNTTNTAALLLKQLSFHSLLSRASLDTDLALIESIQLLRLEQVQVDRERVRDQETAQRYRHRNPCVPRIDYSTEHGRENRTTRHRRNKERRTALSVAAKTTQRQREDCRKNTRLKKQHYTQHRNRRIARGRNSSSDEDNAPTQEPKQNESRLNPLHHQRGNEAAHSEQRLRDSEKVRAVGGGETGLDFGDVVDEEASDCDLGTDVAELRCDAPEKRVLATEGLVDVAGGGFSLCGLGGDVGVCDLGDAVGC